MIDWRCKGNNARKMFYAIAFRPPYSNKLYRKTVGSWLLFRTLILNHTLVKLLWKRKSSAKVQQFLGSIVYPFVTRCTKEGGTADVEAPSSSTKARRDASPPKGRHSRRGQ